MTYGNFNEYTKSSKYHLITLYYCFKKRRQNTNKKLLNLTLLELISRLFEFGKNLVYWVKKGLMGTVRSILKIVTFIESPCNTVKNRDGQIKKNCLEFNISRTGFVLLCL